MKKLTLKNLNELAIGSAILGSGGGGDTSYCYMMARYEMEKNGPVSLINASELKSDCTVLTVGAMGAPLAEIEKIPSGNEFSLILDAVERKIQKKIDVLMPYEIGGGNAFTPLMVAAQLGLPVLDADIMGRAFPETQMTSCHLRGISPAPAFIVDCLGNISVIEAKDSYSLEKIGRQIVVAMGSIGSCGIYPMTGSQAAKCVIHKSISKAIALGKHHLEAKKMGNDPLQAVLSLYKGICIGSGKIIDIDRGIANGFLKGYVKIQSKDEHIELIFKNEYLIAKTEKKILATTPDILMLLEQGTGTPITSEALQYGLKVHLFALPAPEIWTTQEGLALVGPKAFGYEIDYQPINKNKE